ncbi:hypothetical protein BFP72_03855 [Reichenbachiella sp. 5M10]|uniref:molybdopterin molybdotransferase MoeA n=1 Tax=Reichenbachiella sp. 5M10 TaxID=1889772 RepID=UPI000C1601BC|nr:molybdopterin molybdotransferase MoeA [Reichenbachiella sp. 5M10]PIB34604.1 hypothetical protein BFP72_03855 [Reichenbachiella sp. 5M10]
MISVEEARNIIAVQAVQWGQESVPLSESLGRVLAQDVYADRDFPPFDRVTMDGVAIRYEDYQAGQREYEVIGTQYAGEEPMALVGSNLCIEIMTGAMLDRTGDVVIRYEDVEFVTLEGKKIARVQDEAAFQWKNVHRQGSDQYMGELLMKGGQPIHTGTLALLATVGCQRVEVHTYPRIAVISTGDELVEVGEEPKAYQIRKSNVVMIEAVLRHLGIECMTYHLTDNKEELRERLPGILKGFDVLLLSGGVSKGKADYLPEILEELGVEKKFHKVAQRPGKPFWYGIQEGVSVFAFPGNPISAMMCFEVYFLPWMRRLLGLGRDFPFATLTEEVTFKPDLGYFLQVTMKMVNGEMLAHPQGGNGSGDLANLGKSTGFLYLPAGQDIYPKGGRYVFVPFSPL